MDKERERLVRSIQARRQKKHKLRIRRRVVAIVAMTAVLAGSCGFVYTASAKEITLTEINEFDGTEYTQVIRTHTDSVEKILEDNGYTLSGEDSVSVPIETEISEDTDIVIKRGRQVTVRTPDGDNSVSVTSADLRSAVIEAGYSIDDDDEVYSDGNVIEIVYVENAQETETESIPFETEYSDDDTLAKGETKVASEGEEGEKTLVYSVTRKNGIECARELVDESVTKEAQNKVILRGTKDVSATAAPSQGTDSAQDTQQTSSGESAADTGSTINGMKYTKKINMTATAYSTSPSENGGYTVSAMGNPLGHGIVAVDPSVIPLGSKVYVAAADGSWVYGVASAEDTGGAIKGNKIDLCYDGSVSDINQLGVRDCVVYVLE